MNQSDKTKIVDFTKCKTCIHFNEKDSLTCDECLLEPVNYESSTPIHYIFDESKKKEKKIMINNKDFYERLPGYIVSELESIINDYQYEPWFEKAWYGYRIHILNSSKDRIMAPHLYFDKFINKTNNQEPCTSLNYDNEQPTLFGYDLAPEEAENEPEWDENALTLAEDNPEEN